jgi:hypothetical protein
LPLAVWEAESKYLNDLKEIGFPLLSPLIDPLQKVSRTSKEMSQAATQVWEVLMADRLVLASIKDVVHEQADIMRQMLEDYILETAQLQRIEGADRKAERYVVEEDWRKGGEEWGKVFGK